MFRKDKIAMKRDIFSLKTLFIAVTAVCFLICMYIHPIYHIVENANILFYNSPIIAETGGYQYIAYLKNDGKVCVSKISRNLKPIESYVVHDYGQLIAQINRRRYLGEADDHAAPALIYDAKLDTLLLATSYHGTDAYIYKFDKTENRFIQIKQLKGYFTYPRFITYNNNTLLFLREQVGKNRKTGNIIMYNSSDNFSQKELVKESEKDKIIYASRPFLNHNDVYFSYGYHNYQKKYIEGWYILVYNLENKSSKVINISVHAEGFIENRPTGIAVKDDTIRVGTSYLDQNAKDDYIKRHPSFELCNTVKIIDVKKDDKDYKVNKVFEKRVQLPYYGSSVYIDEKLNYVFFDGNKIISNLSFLNLNFDFDKKMYPYIYQNHLFYVVPTTKNATYQIRNFHTDLRALKIREK